MIEQQKANKQNTQQNTKQDKIKTLVTGAYFLFSQLHFLIYLVKT